MVKRTLLLTSCLLCSCLQVLPLQDSLQKSSALQMSVAHAKTGKISIQLIFPETLSGFGTKASYEELIKMGATDMKFVLYQREPNNQPIGEQRVPFSNRKVSFSKVSPGLYDVYVYCLGRNDKVYLHGNSRHRLESGKNLIIPVKLAEYPLESNSVLTVDGTVAPVYTPSSEPSSTPTPAPRPNPSIIPSYDSSLDLVTQAFVSAVPQGDNKLKLTLFLRDRADHDVQWNGNITFNYQLQAQGNLLVSGKTLVSYNEGYIINIPSPVPEAFTVTGEVFLGNDANGTERTISYSTMFQM